MTGAPVPVANKLRREERITRSSSARMRGGGGRADKPARFGGARLGLGIETQVKSGHPALRRSQHEPAAGGQIENPWRSRNFDDERAKRRAGQGIEARPQNGGHIGRVQQQKAAGIEPQLDQPSRRNLPMLQRREIRPEPQDPPALGRAGRQSRDEPGRCRLIARYGGENLMQRALEKPPMQAGIRIGMPQRHPRLRMHILQPRPGEAAPQKNDLFRRHIHGRPA